MDRVRNKYNNIFLSRISEIRVCLQNELYLSALSISLTLPDMCGKAEFPNDGSKKRYIEWFDRYIEHYKPSDSMYNKDMPYLSGEVAYQLRCELLHAGNPNIDKDKIKSEDNKIDRFVLKYGNKCLTNISGVAYGANFNIESRMYDVYVEPLCERLCDVAEKYYHENIDKFNFLHYQFKKVF